MLPQCSRRSATSSMKINLSIRYRTCQLIDAGRTHMYFLPVGMPERAGELVRIVSLRVPDVSRLLVRV